MDEISKLKSHIKELTLQRDAIQSQIDNAVGILNGTKVKMYRSYAIKYSPNRNEICGWSVDYQFVHEKTLEYCKSVCDGFDWKGDGQYFDSGVGTQLVARIEEAFFDVSQLPEKV